MISRRVLIHSVFLFSLPVIVAAYGLSTFSAVAAVLLALLWRWTLAFSALVSPEKRPPLELETISASHFAEKVRWSMDRLGVDYTERQCAGVLGAVLLGRTVPRLWFRTGAVRSMIGNSAEILRYLWGRYAVEAGTQAAFLEPTQERLELEQRIDRVGADLQVWVYYHLLGERELTLHAWGRDNPVIPAWQRWSLVVCYPLLATMIRAMFKISDGHYARAVEHIETLLGDAEARLKNGNKSLLGGERFDYVDISFAAVNGLWLQPAGYGGGKADTVRIERERVPEKMRTDIVRWVASYPLVVAHVERLYREERT